MDVGTIPPRHSRGLTLVELATTLAVASVFVAVAIPGWASFVDNSRLTTATNTLLTHLRYARNHSVSQFAMVSLCPSVDGSGCSGDPFDWQSGYLVFVDGNGNRSRESGEELLRVVTQGPPNLQLQSTAGRPAIRFDPDGAAWGSNTTFSICIEGSGAPNRAVILHGAGRARASRKTPGGGEVTCI